MPLGNGRSRQVTAGQVTAGHSLYARREISLLSLLWKNTHAYIGVTCRYLHPDLAYLCGFRDAQVTAAIRGAIR